MPSLIITIDDDSIAPDTTVARIFSEALDPDSGQESHVDTGDGQRETGADPLTVGNLHAVLEDLPPAAVDIAGVQTRHDWKRGEPCPECDNRTLSVMAASEDIYNSCDGDFQYLKAGDVIGPTLSILCPECMTQLVHTPYQQLAV